VDSDEWVCLENEGYTIERIEIRATKKRPLIIESPDFWNMFYMFQKYLNLSKEQTRAAILSSVLLAPEPCFERYMFDMLTMQYLERG
jgi:hypothetical protein